MLFLNRTRRSSSPRSSLTTTVYRLLPLCSPLSVDQSPLRFITDSQYDIKDNFSHSHYHEDLRTPYFSLVFSNSPWLAQSVLLFSPTFQQHCEVSRHQQIISQTLKQLVSRTTLSGTIAVNERLPLPFLQRRTIPNNF